MAGECEIMMDGTYRKPNTITTTRARRLEWAGRNIK
jgi:hypothetical protein